MSPLRRLFRFLREYLDVFVFAGALLATGPLITWWVVVMRRNVFLINELATAQAKATATSPAQLESMLDELAKRTARQLYMVSGESTAAAFLFALFAGALFVIALRRRLAKRSLQRLLQFSTHELKTPIAALRTLLQTMERGAIPAADQPRFLQQGIVECNRLEHMAETILAYQHATVLEQPALERCESTELIRDVIEHRKRTFGSEQISWEPGPSTALKANRDAFRVVFENLLDNARKYGGGKVQVEESTTQRAWQLRVKDQGIGFESKDAELLFEPFQRKTSGKVTTHGSGLGLYLARQMARSMKGELFASSEGPGKGSTFVLELKVAAAAKIPGNAGKDPSH